MKPAKVLMTICQEELTKCTVSRAKHGSYFLSLSRRASNMPCLGLSNTGHCQTPGTNPIHDQHKANHSIKNKHYVQNIYSFIIFHTCLPKHSFHAMVYLTFKKSNSGFSTLLSKSDWYQVYASGVIAVAWCSSSHISFVCRSGIRAYVDISHIEINT